MATNGLFPAFVRIYYTTEFARHVMTRPCRELTYLDVGDNPTLTMWSGSTINMTDMIDDLVAAWTDILPTTTNIDYADVFAIPVADEPPIFVTSHEINEPGTIAIPEGTARAVQHEMMFKANTGGDFKFVSLDRPSGDFWGKSTTLGTAETVLKNYIIGNLHAWSARDDARPQFFRRLCVTLNDRLMRSYGIGS